MITLHYSRVSEETARQAKQAISFSDYVEGSATENYKRQVDECYKIACFAAEKKQKQEERIQYLLDLYSRKLAEIIDKDNRNTASCPSVMICGGGNFPVRKKEKQNQRAEKIMSEYNYINSIPEKIRDIAYNDTIYSNDEDAIGLLEDKAEKCRIELESMKKQNAYYRKHGTMKGYEGITDYIAEKMDDSIKKRYEWEQKPFADYELTSVRTKMKNATERAEKLKEIKSQEQASNDGEGYTFTENTEMMRIQFFFEVKPDQDIIDILKKNGFRWAPSVKAWQRQLTDNGRYAAQKIVKFLNEKKL